MLRHSGIDGTASALSETGPSGRLTARPRIIILTTVPSTDLRHAQVAETKAEHAATVPIADRVAALHDGSFAWAMVCCDGRVEEAEDVLQTVYCKIVDGRARFAGRSSLKTWIFAVIRRTATDLSRRRWLRRGLLEGAWRREPPSALASDTPEIIALAGDRRVAVHRALRMLSARQRRMLELVFFHDCTVREAADILGLRLGTARVHYQRGKQMLARHLSEETHHAP